MPKCPKCGKPVNKIVKEWDYAQFNVKSYICNCGQHFREYTRKGQLVFILAKNQDGRYRKVKM